MKIQIGENRIRVLGDAIVGNMFWLTDPDESRHPIRRRAHETIEAHELGVDQYGKKERPRHFWAFPVWNYRSNQVQILEITQRTIQDAIYALHESQDWGDPKGYDILIRKSGSGLETSYNVLPGKAAPVAAQIMGEFVRMNVNLDALYDGDDPFANAAPPDGANRGGGLPTQGMSGNPPASPASQEQVTIAVLASAVKKTAGDGREFWIIDTSEGTFGALDPKVGLQAQPFVGKTVQILWKPTPAGGRMITAWAMVAPDEPAPASEGDHVPADEAEIPF